MFGFSPQVYAISAHNSLGCGVYSSACKQTTTSINATVGLAASHSSSSLLPETGVCKAEAARQDVLSKIEAETCDTVSAIVTLQLPYRNSLCSYLLRTILSEMEMADEKVPVSRELLELLLDSPVLLRKSSVVKVA